MCASLGMRVAQTNKQFRWTEHGYLSFWMAGTMGDYYTDPKAFDSYRSQEYKGTHDVIITGRTAAHPPWRDQAGGIERLVCNKVVAREQVLDDQGTGEATGPEINPLQRNRLIVGWCTGAVAVAVDRHSRI